VLVGKADVRMIMCDAWLCPTDPGFKVKPWVRKALGLKVPYLTGYAWNGRRAVAYDRDAVPLVVETMTDAH
jgi:hypothetical protein